MYKGQGTNRVTFAIWNIPHTTIFHFIKFYRRCERIFCKWFCFVTLSKLCSYKNTFSFFPFFELAAERKLCYGGGDEENFKSLLARDNNYFLKILEKYTIQIVVIHNSNFKDIVCMITLLR